MKFLIILAALVMPVTSFATSQERQKDHQAIVYALDSFHQAAATANAKLYLGLLSDNAIFLGTDGGERWTKSDFSAFVTPYFEQGKGWVYQANQRNISFVEGASVAFFDESLVNNNYGDCRGTGVMVKTSQGWKISQYSLSIPLPNALSKDIVKQIQQHKK